MSKRKKPVRGIDLCAACGAPIKVSDAMRLCLTLLEHRPACSHACNVKLGQSFVDEDGHAYLRLPS